VFLGLAMLLGATSQAAAVPVAFADSGSVHFHAAGLQVESDSFGGLLHPDNDMDCVTFVCHGTWFVADSDGELFVRPGMPANPARDRSIAGNIVLPPLHPPKTSARL